MIGPTRLQRATRQGHAAVLHLEWNRVKIDREGRRHHVTGATSLTVEDGKTRHTADYIFDRPARKLRT